VQVTVPYHDIVFAIPCYAAVCGDLACAMRSVCLPRPLEMLAQLLVILPHRGHCNWEERICNSVALGISAATTQGSATTGPRCISLSTDRNRAGLCGNRFCQ